MGPIADMIHYGAPWWVYHDLQADTDLVVPQDAVALRGGAYISPGGDQGVLNNYRLIVLGYQYQFRAGAAGVQFTLEWTDNTVTPALQRTILTASAAAANDLVEGGTSFCFIPGPAGAIVDGDIEQPAQLRMNVAATPPTSGSFLVWGIQTDADFRPCKKYTGSPLDLGA